MSFYARSTLHHLPPSAGTSSGLPILHVSLPKTRHGHILLTLRHFLLARPCTNKLKTTFHFLRLIRIDTCAYHTFPTLSEIHKYHLHTFSQSSRTNHILAPSHSLQPPHANLPRVSLLFEHIVPAFTLSPERRQACSPFHCLEHLQPLTTFHPFPTRTAFSSLNAGLLTSPTSPQNNLDRLCAGGSS